MNRWEMEKKIVIAALKDSAFKKRLLSHPKEALKELFKGEMVHFEKMHIKIQEEKKNEWILSIPHIEIQTQGLSDKDLEKIAGGTCYGTAI